MDAVVVNKISKSYHKGTVPALNNVSFEVQKGEIFGLIGPDGAGKTSLFRILTTVLLADQGDANITGYDVIKDFQEIRNRIGYMPGKFSLYPDLTVKENLVFFATLFNTTITENYTFIKEIYEQIAPFENRRAGKLSGGMKQKLALCCALIHKPEVLLLDEPTTGVDAVSRKEFWTILKNLQQHGITILISTPYMDEAGQCDRIALIQQGKILSVDTPRQIINSYPVKLYAIKSKNIYALQHDILSYPQTESCYPFGGYLHVTLNTENEQTVKGLLTYISGKNHPDLEIKTIEPNIEDSFIRLMSNNMGRILL
jgi:ABC-2 type transport system ATP-binding protein